MKEQSQTNSREARHVFGSEEKYNEFAKDWDEACHRLNPKRRK